MLTQKNIFILNLRIKKPMRSLHAKHFFNEVAGLRSPQSPVYKASKSVLHLLGNIQYSPNA